MDNKWHDRFGELEASNGSLHQANQYLRAQISRKEAEITRLQADNEALRARVAEVSGALESLREPWDLRNILGAETRRRVEEADQALSGECSKAWPLLKQAEAFERFADGLDRKAGAALWDLEDFQKQSRAEAQSLRNAAEQIERGE